jgi:tetratricopeptide (TPR) repeat protein
MATEGRRLLESWKEISAYLNRSTRTCHRWEETLGLPIHRLDGTPSARVFAYPDELDGWLQEKLHHAEDEANREAASRSRKWISLLAGAAVLTAAAVAVTLIWHPFSPLPVMSPNPSLAVLPFENSTGNLNLGPWRTALQDLVITDLAQSRYVNVVRITDLLRKLVELKLTNVDRFSDADLKTVAEKLGVEYVVTGTLTRTGRDTFLSAVVQTPKGSGPAHGFRVPFRDEQDMFGAADALSLKIKQSLGLPKRLISRDIARPVSAVSTTSPQAFKLFSQGCRLAGLAKYPESIAILQKAVEQDPEFALAYKYLYRACQNASREEDEKAYIRMAMDRSARLSDRERGELEVLFYRYYGTDPAKELDSLERLARTYPEDRFGNVNLLGYYLRRELWGKALPVAERAWPANRSDINLCGQLAFCYANLGQWDRAESVLTDFVDRNPGQTYWRNAVELRSTARMRQGKFDEALADVDRLAANFPNDRGFCLDRGIVLLYKEDLDAAEMEFRKALAGKDTPARIQVSMLLRDLYLMEGRIEEAAKQIRLAFDVADGAATDDKRATWAMPVLRMDLAYLYRATGRFTEAFQEVEAARQAYEKPPQGGASPPLELLHMRALLLLDLDRPKDFEFQAEELRQAIEQRQTPRLMRIYYHVLGQAEMKKGDYRKAVDYFSRSVDLAPFAGGRQLEGADPEYWYSLAQAHAQVERGYPSTQAFSAYEKIAHPSVNRLHHGDMYARSLYEMARYYDDEAGSTGQSAPEIKADTAKAIEKYREFLGLWGGADPSYALLIENARARLAALGNR